MHPRLTLAQTYLGRVGCIGIRHCFAGGDIKVIFRFCVTLPVQPVQSKAEGT